MKLFGQGCRRQDLGDMTSMCLVKWIEINCYSCLCLKIR